MNIIHLKYAVEIAKAGSINKAAETLMVAQPNLSRAIRDLEGEIGIVIFRRSPRGMTLTPEGEEFIGYATSILRQIEQLEMHYKKKTPVKQKFSISVPRASYISDAFARFSLEISDEPAEIFYKETNSSKAIQNILQEDYKLGILRYQTAYDQYFQEMMNEKHLTGDIVAEFRFLLVMNANGPLADKDVIHFSDLTNLIEIAHADPYVPSIPLSVIRREAFPDSIKRRIFVFERGSQFELLAENKETFMWVSPLPDTTMKRFGLVQKPCIDNKKEYRDVLVRRKDYKLTALDKKFIKELKRSKERYF